jgi:hypothetical protein
MSRVICRVALSAVCTMAASCCGTTPSPAARAAPLMASVDWCSRTPRPANAVVLANHLLYPGAGIGPNKGYNGPSRYFPLNSLPAHTWCEIEMISGFSAPCYGLFDVGSCQKGGDIPDVGTYARPDEHNPNRVVFWMSNRDEHEGRYISMWADKEALPATAP